MKKIYKNRNMYPRKVVLLDNESNMDLLCNPDLVEYIKKVKVNLRIQSKGGEMSVNQKAKIPGYNNNVWFSRRDTTKIIALKNITEHYRVNYDRTYQMFILHREVSGLPNMKFLMHDSGLHYYEPTKKDLVFLKTVSKNKKVFSKRQIKSVVKAQKLHHTLGFPTVKEVKWIIRSNQIQDCTVRGFTEI